MTATEEFCAEFEDEILITALAALCVWTISIVAAVPQKVKGHYTLPYHARMASLWICIASTLVGCIAGWLCMLRAMDKTVAREGQEWRNREQEKRKLEDALKRATVAEAELAKCQEACCKPVRGRLPAKGTCAFTGSSQNPRPTANNGRRLYN